MKAIDTDITYIQPGPGGCPMPFHTYWELLCNQLFAEFVPGLSESETFDEVQVWYEGVITRTGDESPYTFTLVVEEGTPKANDVLLYHNKYYIIGSVAATATEGTYTYSNCIAIDLSIVGVYTALLAQQQAVGAAESSRVTAENGRVSAEDGRVLAENGRVSAESQRVLDFNTAQTARSLAYSAAEGTENGSTAGDGSRWGAFKSAEASRMAEFAELLKPWVVVGKLSSGEFVADDEEDLPTTAKTRFDNGLNTYLTIPSGRIEAIIAEDTDYLYTASWKWKFTEE